MAARSLVAISVAALLASCAVGPDFHRPAAPTVQQFGAAPLRDTLSATTSGGEVQHFLAGQPLSRQWWSAFQSAQVDALVERALVANPDLQAAQAALRSALESAAAQRGAYFPVVAANLGSTKQQDPLGTLSPTLSSGVSIFSLHTAQLDLSYALDLFGSNRRQVESALASAEGQRYQMRATYLTLISNTIVAAITQASAQAQLDAVRQIVQRERESLLILRRQYDLGSISKVPLSAQEASLAQMQAMLPGLEQQLTLQHDLLAQLTGRLPAEMPFETLQLSSLSLPQQLPLSVPSSLVDQRPDVRVAEAQLHAATAQVGVAQAALLPNISLTADAGTTAVALGQLLEPGTRFWSLGISLSQTLFEGGSLVHRKRAAVAVMDQAAAQYRSTVLLAFRQVADALAAVQADAATLEAQARAEHAAAQGLQLTQDNVQLGASSELELLDAERVELQAVVGLEQARAARLADTVALFQALGGSSWESER